MIAFLIGSWLGMALVTLVALRGWRAALVELARIRRTLTWQASALEDLCEQLRRPSVAVRAGSPPNGKPTLRRVR